MGSPTLGVGWTHPTPLIDDDGDDDDDDDEDDDDDDNDDDMWMTVVGWDDLSGSPH